MLAQSAAATPTATATATAIAATPTPTSSTAPSSHKPRLLWRSSLLLQDGTQLPGVAFASHIHPFVNTSPSSTSKNASPPSPTHNLSEAEANLCLALEMLRHRPIRITKITTTTAPTPAPPPQPDSVTKSISRQTAPILTQPSFGASRRPPSDQASVQYLASGAIRVYLDPTQLSTVTFFERAFCQEPHLVPPQRPSEIARTSTVFTISLDPANHPSQASQAHDVFADSLPSSSARSQLVLFGQLAHAPSPHALLDFNSPPPSKVLRLVLGTKVTTPPKPVPLQPRANTQRSLSANFQSSLDSVFSQAGLSLPQFGLHHPPAPRPDDPLPRGSIASLLQARSQKRAVRGSTIAPSTNGHDTHSPSASPFLEPIPPAGLCPRRSTSRPALEHVVDENDHCHAAPVSRSSLARGAANPSGARTPGRRGEKRRQNLLTAPTDHGSLDEHSQPIDSGLSPSPSKRRKHRADRIQMPIPALQPRLTHLDVASSSLQVKSESTTPEPVSAPAPAPAPAPRPDSRESSSGPTVQGAIERSNRSMIKKLVHTILVSERGLSRSDPDYTTCYTQAYSGTWCAFRRQGASVRLSKEAIDKVVRLHLGMYLDGAW